MSQAKMNLAPRPLTVIKDWWQSVVAAVIIVLLVISLLIVAFSRLGLELALVLTVPAFFGLLASWRLFRRGLAFYPGRLVVRNVWKDTQVGTEFVSGFEFVEDSAHVGQVRILVTSGARILCPVFRSSLSYNPSPSPELTERAESILSNLEYWLRKAKQSAEDVG